jgi:hypothetical protein
MLILTLALTCVLSPGERIFCWHVFRYAEDRPADPVASFAQMEHRTRKSR